MNRLVIREQIESGTNDELDFWVARYVFGQKKPVFIHDPHLDVHINGAWYCAPNYFEGDECNWEPLPFSSDITYTARIIPVMEYFNLRRYVRDQWLCHSRSCGNWNYHTFELCKCVLGEGITKEVAICRAALLAVLED